MTTETIEDEPVTVVALLLFAWQLLDDLPTPDETYKVDRAKAKLFDWAVRAASKLQEDERAQQQNTPGLEWAALAQEVVIAAVALHTGCSASFCGGSPNAPCRLDSALDALTELTERERKAKPRLLKMGDRG